MPVADADRIERKLTTILAADVEGYSRLMAADEVAAMAALKDSRAVFARLIERHRGRIANTAGDGLIADFPSVVEAVQCAAEVQTELAARNARLDPAAAMRFRIGVHLGDVMLDGGDLFGEGVNLAARLQAMAEPGGVLISQAVYDQVRSKLSIGYEFLGQRRPKNLDEPVPVYRLLFDTAAPIAASEAAAASIDTAPKAAAPPAAAGPTGDLRRRVVRQAQRFAIVWAGLAAINLMAGGGEFWAVWPGIALLAVLGLQAAPLLAQGWVDVQLVRLGVIVAGLGMINLASRSGRALVPVARGRSPGAVPAAADLAPLGEGRELGAAEPPVMKRAGHQHAGAAETPQLVQVVRAAHPARGIEPLARRHGPQRPQPLEIRAGGGADPRQGHGDDALGPELRAVEDAGGAELPLALEVQREDQPRLAREQLHQPQVALALAAEDEVAQICREEPPARAFAGEARVDPERAARGTPAAARRSPSCGRPASGSRRDRRCRACGTGAAPAGRGSRRPARRWRRRASSPAGGNCRGRRRAHARPGRP